MAETIKIVDLDIDEKELLKKLTKLQEEITGLKTETKKLETANKDLDKEGKKNTQQYKDNSKQIEVNKIQTKGLSNEYRVNQSTLVALNSTETRQLGTLQQLELSNKKLREEAKRLDLTRKDGQKRLKDINKQLDTNNKTILKNADATKAQKMNIGNYSSALGGMPGPLSAATRGVQMLNAAFKFLILNPIGLILVAIAGAVKVLGDAMKRNQKAMDQFKAAGEGLKAVYGAMLDRQNDMIKSLAKMDFKGAIKAFKGLGKEIKEDYRAARDLTLALQDLYRQETTDIEQKALLRKAIEENRLASKEASITEQERLVFIQAAMGLELELMDIEMEAALERERIAIAQGEINRNIDEENREIALATENRINVEIASLKRRRTIASELKTIEIKAAKEVMEIREQEALAAAKAVDEELKLEKIKSIAINEIKDQDVEKDKERAEQIKAIYRGLSDAEIELATLVSQMKFDLAQSYLKGIAMLFGAQSKVGKAAAVAETLINTYRSATAAYAAVAGIIGIGPIWAPLAAGAAIVAGLANVKKILAVKTPGGGGGGSMPSSGGMSRPPFPSRGGAADGGLTTVGITKSVVALTKEGMIEALTEAPQKNVIVIEEVTAKQESQESISQVTTV